MAYDIKLAASAIGLDTCIAKARQTWMDKQPGPRPFVHGDDIITNPHYDPLDPLGRQQDPGAKPVPDFEPECHKRVAASYPIYFSAEWKWFIARKGTGSRTIDSTFQLPFSDVDFNLELRAKPCLRPDGAVTTGWRA